MSREVVIAMGPVSAAILALLISRWEQTLRHFNRPRDLVYILLTLGFLGASPIIAALAVDATNPSAAVNAVQCFGAVWGTMLILGPLVADVWGVFTARVGERAASLVAGCIAGVFVVGSFAAAIVLLPWWLLLVVVGASVLVTTVQVRYGARFRRLFTGTDQRESRAKVSS
jgi:hypothetical protein